MMRFTTLAALALVMAAAGCGGGGGGATGGKDVLSPKERSGLKDRTGQHVSVAAKQNYDQALEEFTANDKKGDWNESKCQAVAEMFLKANSEQKAAAGKQLAEAIYNAGLANQRCNKDSEAQKHFQAALAADPNFHRAKAQLALYEYQRTRNIDATASQLDQIIRDAKFQNVEALVGLAALQMERNNDQSDQDGKNDLERAKRNLQRALAIDDSYMPAFNQLAIYYLEQAKAQAEKGTKRRRRGLIAASSHAVEVNQQQLDLAALVASQGTRKNPNYAPIHNTAGLIQVELRNFNGAVKSFGSARRLDPKFFEAHMNYGAVNLGFRGFAEAEKAYREALKLRPKEYEAHLGLALAIRGQIRPGDAARISEAQKHLDEAKKIAPTRAETYYNEAILTQEYRSKGEEKSAIPMLEKAAQQYRDFIAKAGGDPTFADAVKRAKERSQDIEDTVKFIKEGQAAAAASAAPPPPAAKK
jgi:tetratricopeptide (TPR) repeat protein